MKLNIVPARTGIQWVKLGIQTFLRQPLALAGLFFMYMAAVLLLTRIPVAGELAAYFLVPAATLGFMVATSQASQGNFPMPSVLVSAFRAGRDRARSMVVLGALYVAGFLLIAGLSFLIGADAKLPDVTPAATVPATPPATPASGAASGPAQPQLPAISAGGFVVLSLHALLGLVFWFAPALVHWHGVSPAKSLFFSAVAIVRNLGAILTFFATWTVIMFAGMLALGAAGAAFGQPVAATLFMPAALLFASVTTTSMYFPFRDSFVADEPAATTTTTPPGGEQP